MGRGGEEQITGALSTVTRNMGCGESLEGLAGAAVLEGQAGKSKSVVYKAHPVFSVEKALEGGRCADKEVSQGATGGPRRRQKDRGAQLP